MKMMVAAVVVASAWEGDGGDIGMRVGWLLSGLSVKVAVWCGGGRKPEMRDKGKGGAHGVLCGRVAWEMGRSLENWDEEEKRERKRRRAEARGVGGSGS
ncbi:hypothetical protein Tco_0092470 [Tanacetum coccineum]